MTDNPKIDMCAEMEAKRKREQFISNVATRPAEMTFAWFMWQLEQSLANDLGISVDELRELYPTLPASFERTHRDQSALYAFRDEHKRSAFEIDNLLPHSCSEDEEDDIDTDTPKP